MIKYKHFFDKFNEFLEIRNLTDNTIRAYNAFLKEYITWINLNIDKPIEDITYEDIRAYIFFLKKEKMLAATSINSYISQLRFFYVYVLNKPLDKYQVPFMKITTKLPSIVSKEDIFYFIDSFVNIKHKTIAALLYSSGIRVSELVNLRYEDIRRNSMQIYIKKTKTRTDRYAILSKNIISQLTEYWKSAGKPSSGYIFTGRDKDKHISTATVQSFFRKHCEHIKFKIKLTPHGCRHHFGTHLYEEGNDLLVIQKLLGHKTIESTTIYVQISNPSKMNIISPYDRVNSDG